MNEDDIFAGLEGIFDEVDESEIVSVTSMQTMELIDLMEDLTQELLDELQALRPRSQESRDKHSLRNACQVELRKRGISV